MQASYFFCRQQNQEKALMKHPYKSIPIPCFVCFWWRKTVHRTEERMFQCFWWNVWWTVYIEELSAKTTHGLSFHSFFLCGQCQIPRIRINRKECFQGHLLWVSEALQEVYWFFRWRSCCIVCRENAEVCFFGDRIWLCFYGRSEHILTVHSLCFIGLGK